MRGILRTPHWVLFTLALCTFLNFSGYVDEVVKIFASGVVMLWTFAVGYYGEQKRRLMGLQRRSLALFQFNSFYTIAFSTAAVFAEGLVVDGAVRPGYEVLSVFFLVGLIYLVFAAIHVVVFSARTIAEVEQEGPVAFSGYFGKLLMLLFFAIGVWMLQPVVKRYLIEEYDEVNPFESI